MEPQTSYWDLIPKTLPDIRLLSSQSAHEEEHPWPKAVAMTMRNVDLPAHSSYTRHCPPELAQHTSQIEGASSPRHSAIKL